jgi:GR25 family glycosyltransferase involved in LPS biosynthesis
MDLLYINLADQTGRRQTLESNFQANTIPGWRLERVEAVTTEGVHAIPGRIRDGEKACFQSHVKAIGMAKQSPGHVLIAEDDILFGAGSFSAIESALRLVPDDSWDIVFTDLCVTSTHAMLDLLQLRRRAAAEARVRLINIRNMPFAGSTAYIVNRNAKEKVLGLLAQSLPLEFAYDVTLQRAIADNRLRGFVTFPFTTGLSAQGDRSQIQQSHNSQETAMNAFRRLMWLERDIETAVRTIDGVQPPDAETEAFVKILSVFIAPGVP